MSLSNALIVDQLVSKAQASGLFASVNGHEPKNAPESGLTAAVWPQGISPMAARSGLNSTSAVITYMIRLYTSMITEPQDLIDPTLIAAADTLLGDITADYTLSGTVANVDLLGESGKVLEANAGYVELGGTLFRVIDISVPCIVNNAWPQGA